MLVRPRCAKITTEDIVGYPAAQRPARGERPIWFGGGTLASDLKLGALREEWLDSPHLATEAAAEWNAAARNKRKVSRTGPENATPPTEAWVEYTRNATATADQLRTIPRDDHATWAKAARDVSGAFAACRTASNPHQDPWPQRPRNWPHRTAPRTPAAQQTRRPPFSGTAILFMAPSSKKQNGGADGLIAAKTVGKHHHRPIIPAEYGDICSGRLPQQLLRSRSH